MVMVERSYLGGRLCLSSTASECSDGMKQFISRGNSSQHGKGWFTALLHKTIWCFLRRGSELQGEEWVVHLQW